MGIDQLFSLDDRVAIVTGGSTGLGKQIATAFAQRGAHVVLCSRKVEECQRAAAELSQFGVRSIGLACDVTDEVAVRSTVDETLKNFGRIDILVNNAGLAWAGSAERLPVKDWKRVVDINLTGVFICSQSVGRRMIDQKSGSIINIASIAGLMATPPEIADTIAYSTTKAAVIHFTRDLAYKWARYSVRVNCIAPGWFMTKMSARAIQMNRDKILSLIPLGCLGGEEDLKGAAIFLASPASAYITGQTIVVDGGLSLA